MDNLIETNPFTDEFVQNEIKFMQYDQPESGSIKHDGIELRFRQIQGRCDDYLNKCFRIDDWETPVMFIDGQLWMSLSTMEITSSYFGCHYQSGTVAMLGLGTGYTTLRCASDPAVESVTVFERDQRVIDFFYFLHGTKHADLMDKITIIHGDAREKLMDLEFDSVFSDIYQTMLPDEVIEDIPHFLKNNNIGCYRFWGMEKVFIHAIAKELIPTYAISMIDLDYLRHWQTTEGAGMFDEYGLDEEYVTQALKVIAKYPEQMYLDEDLIDIRNSLKAG